jgi:hypothetical protein
MSELPHLQEGGNSLAKTFLPNAAASHFLNASHSRPEIAPVGRPPREFWRESISASGDIHQITMEESRSHGSELESAVARSGDNSPNGKRERSIHDFFSVTVRLF